MAEILADLSIAAAAFAALATAFATRSIPISLAVGFGCLTIAFAGNAIVRKVEGLRRTLASRR